MEGFSWLGSEVSAQPKRTFHFTIYNATFGKSKRADVDMLLAAKYRNCTDL